MSQSLLCTLMKLVSSLIWFYCVVRFPWRELIISGVTNLASVFRGGFPTQQNNENISWFAFKPMSTASPNIIVIKKRNLVYLQARSPREILVNFNPVVLKSSLLFESLGIAISKIHFKNISAILLIWNKYQNPKILFKKWRFLVCQIAKLRINGGVISRRSKY